MLMRSPVPASGGISFHGTTVNAAKPVKIVNIPLKQQEQKACLPTEDGFVLNLNVSVQSPHRCKSEQLE